MTRKSSKNHYARVLKTVNKNGSVRCIVKNLGSHGRKEQKAYVNSSHPGMMIIPKKGWIVKVTEDPDGQKTITDVMCGPEILDKHSKQRGFRRTLPSEEGEPQKQYQITDDMEPGTIVWQLDRGSGMIWRWNETKKTWDLELHAGGDITLSSGGTIKQKSGTSMPTEEDGLTKNPPQ
jgi:hypothetical protein